MRVKVFRAIFSILFMLFNVSVVSAASEGSMLDDVMSIMGIVLILLLAFLFWGVIYSEKNDNYGEVVLSPFRKFMRLLTRSTPIEEEHKILLDHDYDGIRELDNKIPPWFNILFYGTILFSIVYMVSYHIIGSGNIQKEEYQKEVAAAALQIDILERSGKLLNEDKVKFLEDAATLTEGEALFTKNCQSCHAGDGGGGIGPNLTDKYWIHGGGIRNVFMTIRDGVPEKGMESWGKKLKPLEMQAVASYVLSLEGTTPASPKDPEGEIYKPADINKENEKL